MRRVFYNLLLLSVFAGGSSDGFAFAPPLTSAQVFVETNDFRLRVRYEMYDPELQATITGRQDYPGSLGVQWTAAQASVRDGIVSWQASPEGLIASRDTEIGFAVYDPGRRVWRKKTRRYEGSDLMFWTVADLTVAAGVVAWRAAGSGQAALWDREIGCATYDPHAGQWQVHLQRYDGMELSYWEINDLMVADGLVAWRAVNAGQAALGHTEAGFAIYDASRESWRTETKRYAGRLNNAWTILNLAIVDHSVQWTATNRQQSASEQRGYHISSGSWQSGITLAAAAHVAAPASGVAPLGVWFTDMSLGATNWTWDFGGGTNVSTRSPFHLFADPGEYAIVQTVEGPGGTSVATNIVRVAGPPGWQQIDVSSLSLTPDGFRLQMTNSTGTGPLILYASANLVDWVAIATNAPPFADPIEFTDPAATHLPRRFYRTALAP